MLTLQIDNEMELRLRCLAKQEQVTPKLFIEKLISQYNANSKEDFFSYAGLWEERKIDSVTLREEAWRKQ